MFVEGLADMGMKEDVISEIQKVADATGNVNIRAALGAFGKYVKLSTGDKLPTGGALDESEVPKMFPTFIEGFMNYLSSAGGVGPKTITKITSNYSVSKDDQIVQINGSLSSPLTITLPVLANYDEGKGVLIKAAGGINGANIVSVKARTGETIDGVNQQNLILPYSWIEVYSDGSQWLIVSLN